MQRRGTQKENRFLWFFAAAGAVFTAHAGATGFRLEIPYFMMKILDTLLQIENDSKTRVAEAQKQAREIKDSADRKNTDRLNSARAEAAALLLARINETKTKWQEKVQQTLLSEDKLQTDFISAKSHEIAGTTDHIVEIIKNPRYICKDDQLTQ